MHHHVTAAILDLVAGLTPGAPRPHGTALWLVPLDGPPRPPGPLEIGQGAAVELTEDDPPRADRIVAANPTASRVVAYPGDAVVGGLADRVVADLALLAPGARRRLRVEAVEGRWWMEGRLRSAGCADPLLTTGIELAREGEGTGLAAMARTAVWTAAAEGRFGGPVPGGQPPPVEVLGWVLADPGGVVGAAVFRHARVLPPVPGGHHAGVADARPAGVAAAATLLAEIARAARRGIGRDGAAARIADLRVRLMAEDGHVLGLSVVRATTDIPHLLTRPAA